jgi:hypothetical protein
VVLDRELELINQFDDSVAFGGADLLDQSLRAGVLALGFLLELGVEGRVRSSG